MTNMTTDITITGLTEMTDTRLLKFLHKFPNRSQWSDCCAFNWAATWYARKRNRVYSGVDNIFATDNKTILQ